MTILQSHIGSQHLTTLPPSRLSQRTLNRMSRRIERRAMRMCRSWRRRGIGNIDRDTAMTFAVWHFCGTPIHKAANDTWIVSGLHRPTQPSDWATAYSLVSKYAKVVR